MIEMVYIACEYFPILAESVMVVALGKSIPTVFHSKQVNNGTSEGSDS